MILAKARMHPLLNLIATIVNSEEHNNLSFDYENISSIN